MNEIERERLLQWARDAETMPWEHEVFEAVAARFGEPIQTLRDLLKQRAET